MHIADFGKAKNVASGLLLHFFRVFDGLQNTSVNAESKLIEMSKAAGFNTAQSVTHFNIVFGMVELTKATKF